jgi:predicted small lipoprotein YifL
MGPPPACRRRHRRFEPSRELRATLRFHLRAAPDGELALPLRDISRAGVSFEFEYPIPQLSVGDAIRDVQIGSTRGAFRGTLLVMHLSPANGGCWRCGALFFPDDDADLLAFRDLLHQVESEAGTLSAASR